MGIDILTREAQGLSEKRLGELIDYLRFLKYLDSTEKKSDEGDELDTACLRKPGNMKKAIFAEGFDEIPEGFEDYI